MITAIEYIIGAIILILAVALIVLISIQQSKRHGLGNSIAGQGASESYLSRNKIASKQTKFQKWTLILAIVFVVCVVALFIIHSSGNKSDSDNTASATEVSSSESSAAETVSTEASAEGSAEVSEDSAENAAE